MFGWSLDTRGMNNSLYPQLVEGWQGNCTEPAVQQHDVQIVQLQRKKDPFPFFAAKGANSKKIWSKLRVPDTDDVKQKASLFSVRGKICLVYCFMVFVLLFYVICGSTGSKFRKYYIPMFLKNLARFIYEGDSCTGILMKVGKIQFRVQSTFLPYNCFLALASNFQQDFS